VPEVVAQSRNEVVSHLHARDDDHLNRTLALSFAVGRMAPGTQESSSKEDGRKVERSVTTNELINE
jgi:hypothetical protein